MKFSKLIITLLASIVITSASAETVRNYKIVKEFKHRVPCPSDGSTNGSCPGYVVDHIKPLCADPHNDFYENLQYQKQYPSALAKDNEERQLCRAIKKAQAITGTIGLCKTVQLLELPILTKVYCETIPLEGAASTSHDIPTP